MEDTERRLNEADQMNVGPGETRTQPTFRGMPSAAATDGTDPQTHRRTDRQTDQKDGQTDRQTDRQTGALE